MKKVILLIFFLPLMASAQVYENFESGILPDWVQSEDNHWIANQTEPLSGNFSLSHSYDNPEAGTDQTGIPIHQLHPDEGNTRWSFLVRHGYDPSASNNWAVFLISDSEPSSMYPGTTTHGFAVGVNISGYDDTLRLWKIDGMSIGTVIKSKINWQYDIGTGKSVKIVVERSPSGQWKLEAFYMDNLINTAYGTEPTLFNTSWFGVYYKYSSTRDRLLWLDEILIEGVFYEDNEAPFISRHEIRDRNCLEITFSEEPSQGSVIPVNFLLNGEVPARSVLKQSGNTYFVVFDDHFRNKYPNELQITQICDKTGNCSGEFIITFIPAFPEPGDLIITEMMVDPSPGVSLPVCEYVEIFNSTGFTFNMKDWVLASESRSGIFPSVMIPGGGYLIACSVSDTVLFKDYGLVTGVGLFPSLNDARMVLSLTDSSGQLIHGIEYSSEWYGDELKSSGGWALEMIDKRFPFHQDDNWRASSSRKGGTPGNENSVTGNNPDSHFQGLLNVFPEDSVTIDIKFSETVLSVQRLSDLEIDQGKIIYDISPYDPLFKSFRVKLTEPLLRGGIYTLKVEDIVHDVAGNIMENSAFCFGLPESACKGDLLFNELLFNPLPGDVDYIELYNNSEKIIDASRIYFVTVNDKTGDTSALIPLSGEKRCILPGSYYTVTIDKESVPARYFSSDPDYIFQVSQLPAMNDDAGHLILFNRELDKIDEVNYEEKMHYSLLDNKEGIALEKIRPDYPSSERSGWHSASESAGWGTPGGRNSAEIPGNLLTEEVTLSSTKITPDNNGIDDVLIIDFKLRDNGNVITISMFDETGSLVRRLVNNLLAAPETSVIWDGTSGDGKILSTGIYIIYIEIFNSSGAITKMKKVCTIVRG